MQTVRSEYCSIKPQTPQTLSSSTCEKISQRLSSSPMDQPKLSPFMPKRPSNTINPKIETYTSKSMRRISGIHIPKPVDRKKQKRKGSISSRGTPRGMNPSQNKNYNSLLRGTPQKTPLRSSEIENRKKRGESVNISSLKNSPGSLSCSSSPCTPKNGRIGIEKRGKHLSEKGEAEMNAILAMLATEDVRYYSL